MIIRATAMAKYFVTLDVVSFIVQAVGGSMARVGAGSSSIKTGVNVYMAGIRLQEFFILCFLALMISFQKRAIQLENSGESSREYAWRPSLYALYGALTAITVRIIYRIAEYAGGIKPSNRIPFHEAYSYVLDAFPMMIAILILGVFHPGRYLIGPGNSFPRKTPTEKNAEKAAKREAKMQQKYVRRTKKIELKMKKEDSGAQKDDGVSRADYHNWVQDTGAGVVTDRSEV